MSLNKINIVVAGATGYVGLDLINILSKHLRANIKYLCAKKKIGKNINYFDKRIKKKLPKITKIESVNWSKIDVLFTCLPPGESQVIIKNLIKYRNLKSKSIFDWHVEVLVIVDKHTVSVRQLALAPGVQEITVTVQDDQRVIAPVEQVYPIGFVGNDRRLAQHPALRQFLPIFHLFINVGSCAYSDH